MPPKTWVNEHRSRCDERKYRRIATQDLSSHQTAENKLFINHYLYPLDLHLPLLSLSSSLPIFLLVSFRDQRFRPSERFDPCRLHHRPTPVAFAASVTALYHPPTLPIGTTCPRRLHHPPTRSPPLVNKYRFAPHHSLGENLAYPLITQICTKNWIIKWRWGFQDRVRASTKLKSAKSHSLYSQLAIHLAKILSIYLATL